VSEMEKFRDSNRQISSTELVEAVENVKRLIHNQFETSPSKDSEGREECYRQIKGIEMGFLQLIRDLE
jgi:hypothetical protein